MQQRCYNPPPVSNEKADFQTCTTSLFTLKHWKLHIYSSQEQRTRTIKL